MAIKKKAKIRLTMYRVIVVFLQKPKRKKKNKQTAHGVVFTLYILVCTGIKWVYLQLEATIVSRACIIFVHCVES